MAFQEFNGELDEVAPASFKPFEGEMDEEGPSLGEKSVGLLEAGAGMLAPLPSQIAGGLSGLGALVSGQSVDEATRRLKATQESNFGFGAYTPTTETGKHYLESLGGGIEKVLQAPGEVLGRIDPSLQLASDITMGVGSNLLPFPAAKGLKGSAGAIRARMGGPEAPVARGLEAALTGPRGFKEFTGKLDVDLSEGPATGGRPISVDVQGTAFRELLDANSLLARERQRAEAIPKGQMEMFPPSAEGLAEPYNAGMAGVTEPIAPLRARAQMELPMGEALGAAERGALSVDPQGQVFRGDVNEPSARLGLQEQGKAFVEELNKGTIPEGLPKGEPLPRLQDPLGPLALETPTKAKWAEGPSGFNLATRKQGGAVNPEVFREGFEKIKELANGITLKVVGNTRGPEVLIEKNGKTIGSLTTDAVWKGDEQVLSPSIVKVDEAFQKRGLASEAYKFLAETGSDVVRAEAQTPAGKALWEGMERKGLAAQGRIKRQSGAVKIDWRNEKQLDQMKKVPGLRKSLENVMPTEKTPMEVVELAKGVPDVDQNAMQKASNILTKGGLYQSEKVQHPIVTFTTQKVLEADRLSRADVRDYIHDSLAPAMRDLPKKDFTEIAQAINLADFTQETLTPELLSKYGFNEKQQRLVEIHRQVMDYAFEQMNKARALVGKDPIPKRTAYAAMQMSGDFKRLVYKLDENGEKSVVAVLGANTRAGLNKIMKHESLQGKGYIFGEERYSVGGQAKSGDAQANLQMALEHLAENNPATKEFLDVVSDMVAKDAYGFLNAKKHTLGKKGVRGMQGREDWVSAGQNAKNLMDSQLKYAEMMIRWGHIADAAKQVGDVLSGDVKAPNAKAWSESYLQNALGFNPTKTGRALEEAVSHGLGAVGVGKSAVAKTQMYAKKAVNTLLLGLSPGFLMANVIQPFMSMPAMNAWLKTKGLSENSLVTMGYDSLFKGSVTSLKELHGVGLSAFEKGAVDYAKSHHVYGSDLVDTSSLSRKGVEFFTDKVGNFAAGSVEAGTRRAMYYTFVHMLEAQKELSPKEIYGTAHNLTDMAMNNYSNVERPQIYNALGTIGDLSANLSSFKHNELSRTAMFAREMGRSKDARPLLIQLATTVAFAGMTGTLLFQEADWLYKQITKAMGKPDSLTNKVIELSQKANVAGDKNTLSHGMFSLLGLDMSKRLGISDTLPNSLAEAAFPGGSKLYDIGAAVPGAVTGGEMGLKALAREVAPAGLAGVLDRQWYSKQTKEGELAMNRKTLEGQVVRNEADKMAKNFGLTGIHESVEKTKLYETEAIKQAYGDLRKDVLKKANREMFVNGKVSRATAQKFMDYEGDPNALAADIVDMAESKKLTALQAAKLKAFMSQSITQLRHAQRLQKAFPNEAQ